MLGANSRRRDPRAMGSRILDTSVDAIPRTVVVSGARRGSPTAPPVVVVVEVMVVEVVVVVVMVVVEVSWGCELTRINS